MPDRILSYQTQSRSRPSAFQKRFASLLIRMSWIMLALAAAGAFNCLMHMERTRQLASLLEIIDAITGLCILIGGTFALAGALLGRKSGWILMMLYFLTFFVMAATPQMTP